VDAIGYLSTPIKDDYKYVLIYTTKVAGPTSPAIGINKAKCNLAKRVNDIIINMSKNGTLYKLEDKWRILNTGKLKEPLISNDDIDKDKESIYLPSKSGCTSKEYIEGYNKFHKKINTFKYIL
jgi:hypothetical protein